METSIEQRVKDSFARQTVMATIGASITRVEQGEVTILRNNMASFMPGW
jgi:hypothetical protein